MRSGQWRVPQEPTAIAPDSPRPSADAPRTSTDIAVRPSGAIAWSPPTAPAGQKQARGTALDPLTEALDRGAGHAVLHLALVSTDAALPPGLAYLRRLGKSVLERLRRTPGLDAAVEPPELLPDEEEIRSLAAALPPIVGAEYVTPDRLERLWRDTVGALGAQVRDADSTVGAWLSSRAPQLNLVGRVCMHLAEDARDPARPFAFLATYTTGLAGDGSAARHRPLGRALQDYAAASDRDALLTLLLPIRRAAAECPLVRELLDSEDIFRALRWTPDQAHALLREVPRLEAAGIVVRVPDWWRRRSATRPTVQVTIGSAAAAGVGAEALLDFQVECVLDGEPLSDAEWAQLHDSAGGLVRLRGRWVEVEPERLEHLLEHWHAVERSSAGGVSFVEGLRLLAGTRDAGAPTAEPDERDADWVETTAGPWLLERLARLRSPDAADEEMPGLRAVLRPYQRRGVTWLRALAELGLGGCLADDMGLGKTVQILALLSTLPRGTGRGPHLLVVPASLLANWAAEAARFTPGLRLLIAHPTFMARTDLRSQDDGSLADVDVVVTSYGTARRLTWMAAVEWDVLVLDEAQAIKNPGTQQTRAIKKLRAGARFALTGTPVENRLGDLWSILDFTCPGLLGTARAFSRFAKQIEQGAAADRFASLRKLVRPYILRRLKTDPEVAPDLPAKTEMRVLCPLTPAQAALYEKAVAGLAEALAAQREEEGIRRRGLVLAAILGLKQICNHPDQWLGTGGYDPSRSGKFVRLVELAQEIASRQEKLLVFTQFREMTAPLANGLADVFGARGLVLHGGTPVSERGRLVREFQREDGPPYFVLSLKAGGTGLNLTAAQHVVHFDRWWNPAVEDQATDRAFRIGQTRNVLVHKLVCRGTVEEKIDALIEAKRSLAGQVVGESAGPAVLTELPDDELLRVIRLDLSAVAADGN